MDVKKSTFVWNKGTYNLQKEKQLLNVNRNIYVLN